MQATTRPTTFCFCWKDVRRAIAAIAVFALVTSLVQILVTVAVFTGYNANLRGTLGHACYMAPKSDSTMMPTEMMSTASMAAVTTQPTSTGPTTTTPTTTTTTTTPSTPAGSTMLVTNGMEPTPMEWTTKKPPMTTTPVPTETVCIIYTTLSVVDFFVVFFSLLLIYGNEMNTESNLTCYFLPWLVWVPIYVLYESGINIFYFVQQFNDGVLAPLTMGGAGFAIVPLIYWVVKTILLIVGYMVVFQRARAFIQCCMPMPYYNTEPAYIRQVVAKPVAVYSPTVLQAPTLPVVQCTRGCSGGCARGCSAYPSPYSGARLNYGPAPPAQFQLYGSGVQNDYGRGFWK